MLPRTFELEDLVATGYLGLIRAAERYAPALGAFAPFAKPRIRGAILNSVRRGGAYEDQTCTHEPPASAVRPDAEGAIDRGRLVGKLVDEVGRLNARDRRVIGLRYRGELRIGAIAGRLRVNHAHASRVHSGAVRALRARLAV